MRAAEEYNKTEADPDTDTEHRHGRRQQPNNPLLLEEIASRILGFLDSFVDLEACYEVCSLWRAAARPRIALTRPPVLLEGAIDNEEGRRYMQRITDDPDPALLSTRFIFKDLDLGSAPVLRFLERHGPVIQQLELRYAEEEWKRENEREAGRAPPPLPSSARRRRTGVKKLTKPQLHDLLFRQTPRLEVLLVSSLPVHFYRTKIANLYNDAEAEAGRGSKLDALRILEMNINYVGYSTGVLLCGACPKLEELTLRGMALNGPGGDVYGETLLWALQSNDQLHQLKAIRLELTSGEVVLLLAAGLEAGQLRTFEIESTDEVSRSDMDELFGGQASSLQSIEYLSDWENGTGALDLPPMPNLEHLKVNAMPYMEGDPNPAEAPPPQPMDYITKFPRLRVLELDGNVANFAVGELFAEPDAQGQCRQQPALSVEVLQKLPRGLDRTLMTRIGNLFPNLRVIRTAIPREHENLLISVLESCPSLEELFLVLDEDGARDGGGAIRPSLDSIFCGIPEEECKQLRAELHTHAHAQTAPVSASASERLEARLAKLSIVDEDGDGVPSLRNLKHLRRLCIEGPGSWQPEPFPNRGPTVGIFAAPAPGPRTDKLSDLCGYAAFAKLCPSLVFLQLDVGLVELSEACIEHICERMKMERVTVTVTLGTSTSTSTATPPMEPPLRLVRSGLGLHAVPYPLPFGWYGLKEKVRTSVLANP